MPFKQTAAIEHMSSYALFKNDFVDQQYARNQIVAKFLVKGPFF
jgi:hypothetical protein